MPDRCRCGCPLAPPCPELVEGPCPEPVEGCSFTTNCVADTPARTTFFASTSYPDTARLPSACFRPSNGRPASSMAPITMSPAMPEKQSKYRILLTGSEVSVFFEAVVLRVAENHVIDHVDAQQDPRRLHPARQLHIVWAWCRIAGRVIVEDDDGRRTADRGFAVDVARLDNGRVQRPDRNNRRSENPMLGVEQDHAELLDRAAP